MDKTKNTTTIPTITGSKSEGVNLSEESEDDENNWQTVATKRRNAGSPNIFQGKRMHIDDGPSTSNRYQALANDNADTSPSNDAVTSEPKPPPIFIPHVTDIVKMVNRINKEIPSTDYHYKSLSDGQIRIAIKNVDSYRKVIKYLDQENFSYHTFQLKKERAFRVIIKGLHHTTPIADIKAMLLSLGHQVRSVRNVISRVSKMPLPMFFVDVDPKENNKEIYNIRTFDNAIISIEAPKKFEDIVQCHRCQDFGHTKSYCKKDFRCVKCGKDHATGQCTKLPTTPAKCVHCNNEHTASYRGCVVYQKLLHSRNIRTNKTQNISNESSHYLQSGNQHNNIPRFQDSNNLTYAQAVRDDQPGLNNVLSKIETMLAKQIELTNTLMNMMSMLISKLCK